MLDMYYKYISTSTFVGRGKRGQHKGQHRHFTNEEQLVADAEKARKNREWRVMLCCH